MQSTKRYTLTLDLKDDPELIAGYEEWHRHIWHEIRQSILDAGIIQMEIYRFTNWLFMIMEADGQFSFAAKEVADHANARVQE